MSAALLLGTKDVRLTGRGESADYYRVANPEVRWACKLGSIQCLALSTVSLDFN